LWCKQNNVTCTSLILKYVIWLTCFLMPTSLHSLVLYSRKFSQKRTCEHAQILIFLAIIIRYMQYLCMFIMFFFGNIFYYVVLNIAAFIVNFNLTFRKLISNDAISNWIITITRKRLWANKRNLHPRWINSLSLRAFLALVAACVSSCQIRLNKSAEWYQEYSYWRVVGDIMVGKR